MKKVCKPICLLLAIVSIFRLQKGGSEILYPERLHRFRGSFRQEI